MAKSKIITIANQKGGVGKTTTVINLAHGLAQMGKNLLVVDLDPQGQCATSLGMKPEEGAYYLLTMGMKLQETQFIKQYVRNTGRDNLWLIPGDQTTNAAQTVINAQEHPISWIRETLSRFTDNGHLDYIILDTAPSVGGIQERALWAADFVVIPSSTEYLATDGVKKVARTLVALQQEKGWQGALIGVLPTMFRGRLNEHKASIDELNKGFPGKVLEPIHRATTLSECPGEARTIFEKDPESRSADEYSTFVKEVYRY
ncbi:MAG: ParA family protein [Chloroflexi bacterium]|nr:ParA family protein [Chloroflexota bacterium]